VNTVLSDPDPSRRDRAGNELVEQFSPLVFRIAQRVLGPTRQGEWQDASQAIFLKLHRSLKTWRGQGRFCGWLKVVAARRAIDFTKIPSEFPGLPAEEPPDPRPPAATAAEVRECINRVLAELPDHLRAAALLLEEGLTRAQVAERMGKSLRTVQYWVASLHDALLPCLGK
jgi:RNA polymerase sigma factor (sigma-70 family)